MCIKHIIIVTADSAELQQFTFGREDKMRHIRNFLHNINDVVLAIIIVALAVGIIYWRIQIIMDYPKQLADEQAVYDESSEDAGEAAESGEEAAESAESEETVEQAADQEASEGEAEQ